MFFSMNQVCTNSRVDLVLASEQYCGSSRGFEAVSAVTVGPESNQVCSTELGHSEQGQEVSGTFIVVSRKITTIRAISIPMEYDISGLDGCGRKSTELKIAEPVSVESSPVQCTNRTRKTVGQTLVSHWMWTSDEKIAEVQSQEKKSQKDSEIIAAVEETSKITEVCLIKNTVQNKQFFSELLFRIFQYSWVRLWLYSKRSFVEWVWFCEACSYSTEPKIFGGSFFRGKSHWNSEIIW